MEVTLISDTEITILVGYIVSFRDELVEAGGELTLCLLVSSA